MRIVIVAAALLALAGCKTAEQRNAEDDNFCQGIGARVGSDTYVQCRLAQQQRRDARRAEFVRDIQGTAGSIGDGLARSQAINAASNANRPLNCSSRNNGFGTIETTCQ